MKIDNPYVEAGLTFLGGISIGGLAGLFLVGFGII